MANFSDFFPSAGGGGGATAATTMEINGITYENVYTSPDAAFYAPGISNSSQVYFGDYNTATTTLTAHTDPNIYTFNLYGQALDTYHTVANITSATNGGFFYWALTGAPVTSLRSIYQIKITIDGTAYEYIGNSANVNGASFNRMFVGNILPIAYDTSNNYFNYFLTGGDPLSTSLSNGVIDYTGNALAEQLSLPNSFEAKQFGMKKVYFETSCKVEMMMKTYNVNNDVYSKYGVALIETL